MKTVADILVAIVAVAALVLSLKNYQVLKSAPQNQHQRQLRDELRRQIGDVLSTLKVATQNLQLGGEVGPPVPAVDEYAQHATDMMPRLTDPRIAGGRLGMSVLLARAVSGAWLIAHGAEEEVKRIQGFDADSTYPTEARERALQRKSDMRAKLREDLKESMEDLENLRSQLIKLDNQN